MSPAVVIQNEVFKSLDVVLDLEKSLQKEFEYFAGSFKLNEKMLLAKKRQQAALRSLIEVLKGVFDASELCATEVFKLEGCLLFHGVSIGEILYFMALSKYQVEQTIKETVVIGIVQVPEQLQPLIDPVESEKRWLAKFEKDLTTLEGKETVPEPEPKPVQFSEVPVLGIENIKKLILKQKNHG